LRVIPQGTVEGIYDRLGILVKGLVDAAPGLLVSACAIEFTVAMAIHAHIKAPR
jgi:hypothetical protein